MRKSYRKTIAVVVLTLTLGAGAIAQKRNKNYQPSELSANSAESVVVDGDGINPVSIDRAVGPFLLAVWDTRGRGAEHFSLTEDKKGAPELYGLDTTPDSAHAAVLVDLEPGRYRLSLANTPDVSVEITLK